MRRMLLGISHWCFSVPLLAVIAAVLSASEAGAQAKNAEPSEAAIAPAAPTAAPAAADKSVVAPRPPRKPKHVIEIELICLPASNRKLSVTTTPVAEWVKELRGGPIDELLTAKEKALPILIAAIQDKDAARWLRISLGQVRGERDWLIPVYLAGIQSSDPFTRDDSLKELMKHGDRLRPHLPALKNQVAKVKLDFTSSHFFVASLLEMLDEAEATNEEYVDFVKVMWRSVPAGTGYGPGSDVLGQKLSAALVSVGPSALPALLELYEEVENQGDRNQERRSLSYLHFDPDWWPPLIKSLATDNVKRRRAVASLIAHQRYNEAEPRFEQPEMQTLRSYLHDPDEQVRTSILQAFGQQPPKDDATLRHLTSLFLDPDSTEGYQAASILAKQGAASLPVVRQAALSQSAVLRRRAVFAYREMKPFPETESTRLENLARDVARDVRLSALHGLLETRRTSPEAMALFDEALRDPATKEMTLRGITELGPAAAPLWQIVQTMLAAAQPKDQIDLLRTLALIDPSSPLVIKRVKELLWADLAAAPKTPKEPSEFSFFSADSYSLHGQATRVLGIMGGAAAPAIDVLVAMAGSGDDQRCYHGLQALQRIGPAAKDTVPALSKFADTASGFQRKWLLETVKLLQDPQLRAVAGDSYVAKAIYRRPTVKRRQIKPKTPEQLATAKVKAFVYSQGGSFDEDLILESRFHTKAPLTGIRLHGGSLTDAELSQLAPLPKLDSLSLTFAPITDAGLKEVAVHKQLKLLDLGHTKVTGEGLAHLTDLQQLVSLELSQNELSDAAFVHVGKLKNLEALYLVGAHMTYAGLKHLAPLKRLHTLQLCDTKIGDDGIAHLAPCQSLEELVLDRTNVSDRGVAALSGLSHLKQLMLQETKVQGQGLKALVSLEVLDLSDSSATGVGLGHLVNLRRLMLCNTPLNDAGLTGWRSLQRLKTLMVDGTEITDAGLAELARLRRLEWLDLEATRITDAGLKHLVGLPYLKHLNLSDNGITDAGLKNLAGLTNLEVLELADTKVTTAGIEQLQRQLPTCDIQK